MKSISQLCSLPAKLRVDRFEPKRRVYKLLSLLKYNLTEKRQILSQKKKKKKKKILIFLLSKVVYFCNQFNQGC